MGALVVLNLGGNHTFNVGGLFGLGVCTGDFDLEAIGQCITSLTHGGYNPAVRNVVAPQSHTRHRFIAHGAVLHLNQQDGGLATGARGYLDCGNPLMSTPTHIRGAPWRRTGVGKVSDWRPVGYVCRCGSGVGGGRIIRNYCVCHFKHNYTTKHPLLSSVYHKKPPH
jgi:hypothetical protein